MVNRAGRCLQPWLCYRCLGLNPPRVGTSRAGTGPPPCGGWGRIFKGRLAWWGKPEDKKRLSQLTTGTLGAEEKIGPIT